MPAGRTGAPGAIDALLKWGGRILHLAIGVFPLASSGLMAPPWALATVALGWVVGAVAAWRIGNARPRLTPLVPIVTVAAWFAFMTLGESALGWVA